MTGKTIHGPVDITVTLGSGHYKSPLSITGSGEIAPSAYGAVGIYVPQLNVLAVINNAGEVFGGGGGGGYGRTGQTGGNAIDLNSAASVTNAGLIAAGSGGDSNYFGGNGGVGIDVQANATLTNSGHVDGGGGAYGFYTAGIGGDGVVLGVSASLTNSGTITAGSGGRSNTYNIYAYRTVTGGIGLSTGYEAKVTNTGHITGGDGGYSDQTSTYQVVGYSGGAGVSLGANSTLTNGGTLTGGNGGSNGTATESGGNGGYGLILNAATASNTGLISGGAGSYGSSDGGFGGIGVYVNDYGLLTNAGKVVGGSGGSSNVRYGGPGESGVFINTNATVVNSGNIFGGTGGTGGNQEYFGDGGAQGGAGVYIRAGLLTNSGTITGGIGATTPGDPNNNTKHHDNAGYGGAGIVLGGIFAPPGFATLSAVNYGLVRGGVGGNITSYEGTAGVGGDAALVRYGVFTNHGNLVGGTGGDVGQGSSTYIVPGAGGAGVDVKSGGTLVNFGTIQGGTGGYNIYTGATGGAGVFIQGGVFIDSGAVRGGAGGVSQGQGAAGDAVYLGGTIGGTLVVNPGASFSGLVVAHAPSYVYPAVNNVLEVAGSSSTALTGFGTEFTGFNVISFASGATRAIEGTFGNTAITGLAANDSIILDGFAAVPAETVIEPGFLLLFSGSAGTSLDLSLLQAKDLLISASGSKTTIAAVAGAVTIGNKMAQLVAAHGTATGSIIDNGGIATIDQGGTAAHPTIAGGTLVLDGGASVTSGISFTTVTGGELIIDSTTMPTVAISGFIAGDSIKLAGVAYNKYDLVTVGTAGFVTITGPGTVDILSITGATKGETDFKFSTGSVLTRGAAQPKMAFLAPDASTHAAENGWFFNAFEHLAALRIAPMPDRIAAPTTLQIPESSGFAHALTTPHSGLEAMLIHPNTLLI
jgi:fibronectin-binding autotransporter adhesin